MKLEKLTDSLKLLKLLGDETRLKILCIIGKKRLSGVEILKQLDIAQSSMAFHLSKMVEAKILNAEPVWKYTYYTINNDGIKAALKSFRILSEIAK